MRCTCKLISFARALRTLPHAWQAGLVITEIARFSAPPTVLRTAPRELRLQLRNVFWLGSHFQTDPLPTGGTSPMQGGMG